jgi:signal transduction histidine kinase
VTRNTRSGIEVGRSASFAGPEATRPWTSCSAGPGAPRTGPPDALLDPHVRLDPVRAADGCIADFVCSEANQAALEYLEMSRESLLGASVLGVFPMRAATEMLPQLALTMETGQPLVLDDYLYPSEVFACERRYDVRVVRVGDGLSCTWCDVTQRHEIEECLRRRVGELDFIHRISQLLAVRSDLATALEAAGLEIDELFGARSSRVLVLAEGADGADPGALETASAAGAAATPCETAVIEQALATRRPALIESCQHSARRLLGVPLVSRSRLLGVLTIVREPEAPAFTEHEVTVAESVADALAAAVENERLHQQAAREAAAGERQRLARDLHDSVTQTLYSANLIAEVLPDVAALDAAGGLEGLDKLRSLMRTALSEMRTLLFELRPETLASASLESLLERLGDALAGHEGTTVDVAVDEEVEPPLEVKLAFYRVAQEALTNISKHAQADRVVVAVASDGDGVRLSVRDDGKGFDPGAVRPESMGLRIMRERAQQIGAHLEVRSRGDGEGTEVSMSWHRETAGVAA